MVSDVARESNPREAKRIFTSFSQVFGIVQQNTSGQPSARLFINYMEYDTRSSIFDSQDTACTTDKCVISLYYKIVILRYIFSTYC